MRQTTLLGFVSPDKDCRDGDPTYAQKIDSKPVSLSKGLSMRQVSAINVADKPRRTSACRIGVYATGGSSRNVIQTGNLFA